MGGSSEPASVSAMAETARIEPHPSVMASLLPSCLLADLRTDHSGELGAVMIYRGILAVSRDPALRAFASEHIATEARHLSYIEELVPARERSALLPLWRAAGWLTGALPALAGARAVYATIQAVETFVDRHYAAQVEWIDQWLRSRQSGQATPQTQPAVVDALVAVRGRLEQCRLDEVAHRDEARGRWDGQAGTLLGAWLFCVSSGSDSAVRISRKL